MEVVQIKNPNAFTLEPVANLLSRALAITQRIEPERMAEVAPDVLAMVRDDNAFVFLGEENGQFKLIILGFLPTTKLFPHATIVSFYSDGSRALREAGKLKLMDFIKSRGYNNAWAVNGTGNTDAAWQRVFGLADTEISRVGSVFEIKVKE
jgi:hypothetical protein